MLMLMLMLVEHGRYTCTNFYSPFCMCNCACHSLFSCHSTWAGRWPARRNGLEPGPKWAAGLSFFCKSKTHRCLKNTLSLNICVILNVQSRENSSNLKHLKKWRTIWGVKENEISLDCHQSLSEIETHVCKKLRKTDIGKLALSSSPTASCRHGSYRYI